LRKKHRRELANEIYICNYASRVLFAANAGNFILAITAIAGPVSFAHAMTHPVAKQKVLDTVRDHLLESF
jgi:hypothetical protein